MSHKNEVVTSPDLGVNVELGTILSDWQNDTLRLKRVPEMPGDRTRWLTDGKSCELSRKNQFADLGKMASYIAHELQGSLTPVNLYMSLLRRRISEDKGSIDILSRVEAGLAEVDATVNELLSFGADRGPKLENFEIAKLVKDICASLKPRFVTQRVEYVIDVPDGQYVSADREMLRRAILNLAFNALDVMPGGGTLTITSNFGQNWFELEIADSGPGLLEETQSRAFEPFFTTKCGGNGLGLTIVSRIAELHGGDVNVVNCPEGGAAFTLFIPQRVVAVAA